MSINRYNYESYFLLYIDKELSEQEQAEVDAFVALHPDLGEELALLKKTVVPLSAAPTFDFANLIMPEGGDLEIDVDNYESYFARYVDDELNPLEREAVEKFVLQHPETQPSFEWMQKAKVKPDLEIIFEPKSLLYRKEETERKPVWIFPMRWAAAAALILLAGIWWLQRKPTQAEADSLVQMPVVEESKPIQENESLVSLPNTQPIEKKSTANLVQTAQYAEKKSSQPGNRVVTTEQSDRITTKRMEGKPALIEEKPVAQTSLLASNLDTKKLETQIIAPIVQNQVIDQPMQLKGMEEEKTTYITLSTNATDEEPLYIGNTEVNRKNGLRGVLRKASRMIEKNTSLGHEDNTRKGILIGNISVPLR